MKYENDEIKAERIKKNLSIRAEAREELKTKKLQNIPPEFRCHVSYTGAHMYDVFPLTGREFVAICARCLKQSIITLN